MRKRAERCFPARATVGPTEVSAAGFTVLEVLVAIGLLAAVAVLSGHAINTVLSVVGRSGDVTVATHLAVAKLEEIRSRVEGQMTRDTWNGAFDALVPEGRVPFAAPLNAYAYEVMMDEIVDPAAPCWIPSNPAAACADAHDNMIRWITVKVYHRERLRAEVASAVIRGMWHRN